MADVTIRVSLTRPSIRAVLVRPRIRVEARQVIGGGAGVDSFTVGTAGLDFNIDATDPANPIFNLPTASALNRGALSSGDWSAFNAKASAASVVAAEAAAKAYADLLVVGLWDDRGNYDASGNTYPAAGGSGVAGAIVKGDIWTVSVAGVLGGVAVGLGDTVRALVDAPAQVAGNWAIAENNIGYAPENVANKATDFTVVNNTKYPSTEAVKNELIDLEIARDLLIPKMMY